MQNGSDSQQTSIDDQKKTDSQPGEEQAAPQPQPGSSTHEAPPQEEKFHLEFPYSELVKAQAVINKYLETVFGELRTKLPPACELVIQPGAREDGTPFFTLKVEATP